MSSVSRIVPKYPKEKYPKKNKRTSKRQSILFYSNRKHFWKSHNAEKNWKNPLGFFNIHSVAKLQKKWRGPFGEFFPTKSLAMPKKTERGTLWPLPVSYVTRETFLVQFLRPTGTIFGVFLKFCRTFGVVLFWSLRVYRKKTLTKKAMTIVDSFL